MDLNNCVHFLAKFTETHFGDANEQEDDGKPTDRKTAIEQLIAESKKRKAEKIRDHEEIMDMTQKLDNEWKDLLTTMKKFERTDGKNDKPEPDDYDRLVKEMIFSPRSEPTMKLKSEEELMEIEQQKLKELERQRLERMKDDEDVDTKKSNYRSADDLDGDYFLQPVLADNDENSDQVLSYPLNPEDENENEKVDDDENGQEIAAEEESENEDEKNSSDDEEEEESEVDDLDDLKNDESEAELEDNSEIDREEEEDEDEKEEEEIFIQDPVENDKKQSSNEALPLTFKFPQSYEDFIELISQKSIRNQSKILENLIENNHPKHHHANRIKMIKLFAYLLQYVNDIFSNYTRANISNRFKLIQKIVPFMHDIAQMDAQECSQSFVEVIKEKYENYRKNPRKCPKLDTIIFFKLLGDIFPTSDFRHPIVTPTYIFLHHILSQSHFQSRVDIASGLFLCTLLYDNQQISKRFLPSAMTFLNEIITIGISKSKITTLKNISKPFKRFLGLLSLTESTENMPEMIKLNAEDFVDEPIDDDFKMRAIQIASNLMRDFIALYKEMNGIKYLIHPFEKILKRIVNEENLPSKLKSNISEIIENFESIQSDSSYKFAEAQKKIVPMLRLLEPRFETVLSDRRSMYCQAEGKTAERKKLQHMVKREMKSAKRELRKDNEYLSKIKHKRMLQSDKERKEKVKRIYQEGSAQQGELNAMSRTKGRKNFF
jgi:nucleolar protein 14